MSAVAGKFLLIVAVSLGSFVALQLLVFLGLLVVLLFFPDWEAAKTRLHSINDRSHAYAAATTRAVLRHALWVLLAVLSAITLLYS